MFGTKKIVLVNETQRGALYENGAFKQILNPGRHEIKESFKVKQAVTLVDVRMRSLTIKGQEILTADKVAVGVSILVNYRVVDVKAALHEVESYTDRIYEDVQLSTRRFLAARTLDQILKDRNEISNAVREDMREEAARYGIEVSRADVKDLIFPGRLREIMNLVLETERQSEAKLIDARKTAEAAMIKARGEQESTVAKLEADRAFAELLASSPALMRLKELETLQKISEKPGNSFYIGLGDIVPPVARK
jgi:regulator of protease activity HflC (stomatin/prohibitin superfamily)